MPAWLPWSRLPRGVQEVPRNWFPALHDPDDSRTTDSAYTLERNTVHCADVCAFQRRLTILSLSLTLPPTTNTHDDSVADKRRRQILCPLQKFQKKNVRIRVKIKKWPTVEVLSEIIIIIRHGHTLIYWFLPLMELVRYKKKKKKNLFTLIFYCVFHYEKKLTS